MRVNIATIDLINRSDSFCELSTILGELYSHLTDLLSSVSNTTALYVAINRDINILVNHPCYTVESVTNILESMGSMLADAKT
jgi:hypothetical protein